MLDAGFLANNIQGNQQLFWCNGSTTDWQIWNKPRGYTMVFIYCRGGAGGGGNGIAVAVTPRGGGGGGSGAISKLLIPLSILPDVLYIQVGVGGASATDGSKSFVSNQPNSTVANLYLSSGNVAATKGTDGGDASGGTAGSGETVGSATNCVLCSGGNFTFIAGQSGGAGNNGAGGAKTVLPAGMSVGGGGGGGGSGAAGGDQTGVGLIPTIAGGAGGTVGIDDPGLPGVLFQGAQTGFMMCGGSGGGGATTGSAGNGGNGAIGCGGGGGGSTTSGTAGSGGKGGNGLVGIWCF